jgi:hypothetical protein
MLDQNHQISKILEKFLENLLLDLDVKISKKCKNEIFFFMSKKIFEISKTTGETCEEKSKKILSEEIYFMILLKIKLASFILESTEEKIRFENENLNFEQILY